MTKVTTPKQVFTYIRDTKGYLEEHTFICNAIEFIGKGNANVSQSLISESSSFMHSYRPKDNSFTKHPFWNAEPLSIRDSWWLVSVARGQGKYEELMEEKRRFLTHLIEKL